MGVYPWARAAMSFAVAVALLQGSPAAAKSRLTEVTFVVTGCEGCTLYLDYYPYSRKGEVTAKVGAGLATARLVRNATLYINIDDPARPSAGFPDGYWTGVVMRYKGLRTGAPVTAAVAERATKYSVIWKVPKVATTLSVTVEDMGRRWDTDVSAWDYQYRAFATITQPKRGYYYPNDDSVPGRFANVGLS